MVNTSLNTRGTRAHRTQDATTPTSTHTRVGSLSQGHPGLCDTPVGPGRTPTVYVGPYAGRPLVARQQLHDVTTDTRQQVAEPVRETGDPRRVVELRERTCRLRFKVETSRIIKKITLEKINQEKINHETKYIKISQNQHTDKVVDVTVAVQEQVLPRNDAQSWRRKPDK